MILYSDGPLGSKPITPAHRYVFQSDFGKILEDIERGEIPCGSGKPFPVEFERPEDNPSGMDWSEPQDVYHGGKFLDRFGL